MNFLFCKDFCDHLLNVGILKNQAEASSFEKFAFSKQKKESLKTEDALQISLSVFLLKKMSILDDLTKSIFEKFKESSK